MNSGNRIETEDSDNTIKTKDFDNIIKGSNKVLLNCKIGLSWELSKQYNSSKVKKGFL